MASGGGLPRVDVANDDDVDMDLLLSHDEGVVDLVCQASERVVHIKLCMLQEKYEKLQVNHGKIEWNNDSFLVALLPKNVQHILMYSIYMKIHVKY